MTDGFTKGHMFRPAHAEIDLGALAHNYRVIADAVGADVGIMAMVKADAYGHGAVPVSKKLVACGACALGVATVEEGLELREAGIEAPVLVMGGLMGMGTPASGVMLNADLTPVIHSADVIEPLDMVAQSMKRTVGIHLKIDTGMTRLGIRVESLKGVLDKLEGAASIKVEGVMTHFAHSEDNKYTSYQWEEFVRARKIIEEQLGTVPIWHAAPSAAIVRGNGIQMQGAQTAWVRPGIMLYGAGDDDETIRDVRPVMKLISKVMLIKSVPAGTKVSYGCTFETRRKSRLGIVPVGYADGYPRSFSNKAHVLVRGQRAPVVGRVTMDMIIVDLTDLGETTVGDEVVLLGSQCNDTITVQELAGWADTITYEVLTSISARMPRVYKGSS